MSQVNSYDRESYTTNGVAKSFSFGWNVNSKDDVKIQFVNAKGEIVDSAKFIDANDDEYTTSTYNFTVELNRQGGQIVFVDTPAEDQYLIIYRQTPLVYENSFKTATAFPAAAIDAAYRKIWLAIQEISADSLYNTLRLTPDQRGTVLDAFSDGDNNSFIYYDSVSNKLTYTDFKIQDVENALVYVSQIPSIASDASEALNKANNAIIIANNAKSESELARQDASNAIQSVNGKQDKLVSGVNIKTINGQSVLGSGDLTVTAVASWGSIVGDINDQTDLQNALNDKANTTDLATVATTGDYDDLINKPTIPSAQIQSDWTQADSSAVDYIKNKPSLSAVATSGDYDDLINKPTLGTAAAANTTDFATAAQGSKADTAVQPSDLATVATTGSYNDLLNKPTIPAAQVNSDWAANSGVAQILNKPTLGTAAAANTTDFATAAQGALADTALQAADLVNYVTTNTTQTISGEKVFSGIMNYSAGKTYILAGNGGTKLGYWSYDVDGGSNITLQTMTASTRNINFKTNNGGKVTYNGSEIAKVSAIPTAVSQLTNDSGYITNAVNDLVNYTLTSSLATVATTGDYGDLINTPTIPAAQVNSDWNANSGVAEILNKPTLGTMAAESASDYTPTASLAAVALSGAYSDLSGTPSLATVATSGSYNDLLNKPTIPTVNDATITITQGGVTKGSFTLNQASGDTIALDAGGSSVDIDSLTITKNVDDEIQAVATVNANTAVGATNPIYDWVGTLAEYTSQAVATNHPDWVCYITDDASGSSLFVTKGHEVIDFQEPNAGNNYTWYRKYADGWVEQGGIIAQATSADVNINFPVIMADTNYGWGLNISYNNTNPTGGRLVSAWNFTTTGMTARCDTNFKKYWRVEGMAA